MPSHFSLNIKTLDDKPTAIVLSLGICKFNTTQIMEELEFSLAIEEQIELNRTAKTSRLHWWFEQMHNHVLPRYPFPDEFFDPRSALKELNRFIIDNGSIPPDPATPVNFIWMRGTQFDWSILENLSHKSGIGLAFRHNAIKDQRTFCDPWVQHTPVKNRNALEDAKYHASNIQTAVRLTGQVLE